MPEIHGDATWPGVISVNEASYTISHGISPGLIVIKMLPQPNTPDLTGNFVISDGFNTILIPDCKVSGFRPTEDGTGLHWQLEIEDRRWRWRETGYISGVYNQPDGTGQFTRPPPDSGPIVTPAVKYIPWTIMDPLNLCNLCLQAMGETGYSIQLPAAALTQLPAQHWDYLNPAQALSQLVNSLGCRIVYRLDTDSVLICPVGVGLDLPDGSISHEGASVKVPVRPDKILLVGAPTRFQSRFLLEPVGVDWDKQLYNIELLSYAPLKKIRRAQWILFLSSLTIGDVLSLIFDGTTTITYQVGTTTQATEAAGVVAAINASAYATQTKTYAYVNANSDVVLVGPANGAMPVIETFSNGLTSFTWELSLTARGGPLQSRWAQSAPPGFPNVQATSRLTYQEAKGLAKSCIFRYYRILNMDVATHEWGANIEGFGRLLREQQVILSSTTLDPTYPDPGTVAVIDPKTNQPYTRWNYDGISRERPARVFGEIAINQTGLNYGFQKGTTAIDDEVLIPFTIDPIKQIVVFAHPVYLTVNHLSLAPALTLETSFTLRNPIDNSMVRSQFGYTFPPPYFNTLPAVIHKEDVEYMIAGRYTVGGINPANGLQINNLFQTDDNSPDANAIASYYLLAEAAKYTIPNSGTRAYNGIVPCWLDGAIQQVSWSVGSGGAHTTISRNDEHSLYVPKYPAKLRIEYQAADEAKKATQPGSKLSQGTSKDKWVKPQ